MLSVVPTYSKDLTKHFKVCVAEGSPLILTGPLSRLEDDIMNVVRRQYVKKRSAVVDIGADFVEVHPGFRYDTRAGPGPDARCTRLSFVLSVAKQQCMVLVRVVKCAVMFGAYWQ